MICGGGIAAIEALLALRSLLPTLARIDLVAPNRRFVYQPIAVAEPFGLATARMFELARVATDQGARLHAAGLETIDANRKVVTITGGTVLSYDQLVVAVGAERRQWLEHAIPFGGASDVNGLRRLLARLDSDEIDALAFTSSRDATWTLPSYELALLTATHIAQRHINEVELTIVTPEPEPLSQFGPAAGRLVLDLLGDRGIRIRKRAEVRRIEPARAVLAGGETVPADAVVALSDHAARRIPGLAAGPGGFTPIDEHARVIGMTDVYAAGDCTAAPIKQGGLGAQQADAAAESIAVELGVPVTPAPLRPMLRATLLTGVLQAYLRAGLDERVAGGGEIAHTPLWWPPAKVAARYLAPYVAGRPSPIGGQVLEDRFPHREAARGRGGRPAPDDDDWRALARTCAQADARERDFDSALRWLEVVERLDGVLSPEDATRRRLWRRERGDTSIAPRHQLKCSSSPDM